MERKELIELFKCIERANHPVCNGCPLKYTCDKNQITRCLLGTAADMLEVDEQQITELEKELEIWTARSFEGKIGSMALTNLNLRMKINELEAQLPKKGEWIEVYDQLQIPQKEHGTYRCSACGQVMKYPWNHCPNCGVKMKKEKERHESE